MGRDRHEPMPISRRRKEETGRRRLPSLVSPVPARSEPCRIQTGDSEMCEPPSRCRAVIGGFQDRTRQRQRPRVRCGISTTAATGQFNLLADSAATKRPRGGSGTGRPDGGFESSRRRTCSESLFHDNLTIRRALTFQSADLRDAGGLRRLEARGTTCCT